MLENITTPLLFTYLLVFCRVGMTIIMLPGLGEEYVSSRARLIVALGLSLAMVPVLQAQMPKLPESAILFAILITKEIIIGFFIGTIVKVLFSALNTAGLIIATQSGLGSAMLFDPSQGEQGSSVGVFLTFVGMMVIFAGDIHHIFLRGIVDSYSLFPPNGDLPLGGFADLVTKTTASAFSMGVRIASPVIVIGMVIFLGGGIIGRLMPQMQVFFIMTPVQIILCFSMLIITMSTGLMWFMSYYTDIIGNFIK